MSHSPPRLDDVIALNREIAALVRAGIPLELGLRGLVGSVPSRLGRLAERLADRLANGLSLTEALEQEGPAISPIYTAVVGAGLHSGRLAEVLESLVESAQIEQEARQRVSLAMVYPAIVAFLGYILFVGFVVTVVPAYLSTAEMFGFPESFTFRSLRELHRTVFWWGGLIPSAVLLIVASVYLIEGLRLAIKSATPLFMDWTIPVLLGGRSLLTRWITDIAGIHRSLNLARFVELLRLQVSHGLPLDKAIGLAADATDDPHIRSAVSGVIENLRHGQSLADSLPHAQGLPTSMKWMLATSEQQGTLNETLELMSESYRRRVLYRASMFKFWLPVVTTVCISGVIVLLYGLLFFIPLRELWNGLMHE